MAFKVNIEIKKQLCSLFFEYKLQTNSNRIVIFGPSGCGKSTLLNMIAGFLLPDQGKIVINDDILFSSYDKIDKPINYRKVGYLTQENSLFPNMNIIDNILYGVQGNKCNKHIREYLIEISKKFQINDKLYYMPNTLSGGQKQRASLARIILSNPNILLLDEPFSALDTVVKNCLRKIIVEFSNENNVPILFVTHDINDCLLIGEDVAIINNCKIIEYGQVKNIINTPKLLKTAEILDFKNIWKINKIESDKIILNNEISLYSKRIKNLSIIDKDKYKFIAIKRDNIIFLSKDDKEYYYKDRNTFNCKIVDLIYTVNYCEIKINYENNLYIDLLLKREVVEKNQLKKNNFIKIFIPEEYLIFLM